MKCRMIIGMDFADTWSTRADKCRFLRSTRLKFLSRPDKDPIYKKAEEIMVKCENAANATDRRIVVAESVHESVINILIKNGFTVRPSVSGGIYVSWD